VLQRLSGDGTASQGHRRDGGGAARCRRGLGGTRNIGNTHYHVDLEGELADLHGKEAALLFTSGYVSNEATLALQDPARLRDLLRRTQPRLDDRGHPQFGCEKQVFRHNDLAHLEELLAADPGVPKLIAFESVYSMDGDVAPIAAICDGRQV
jgi:5-aminolevulinate synthase